MKRLLVVALLLVGCAAHEPMPMKCLGKAIAAKTVAEVYHHLDCSLVVTETEHGPHIYTICLIDGEWRAMNVEGDRVVVSDRQAFGVPRATYDSTCKYLNRLYRLTGKEE